MSKKEVSRILAGILATSVVLSPFPSNITRAMAETASNSTAESPVKEVNKNYVYLSDLKYDTNKSKVSYGSIKTDSNIDGGKIRLITDGEVVQYDKGMGAHANSTLVYDVSKYSNTYTHFIVHMGVDYSKKDKGNGVTFKICKSQDGNNWTDIETTGVVTASGESVSVNVDITGANYIRLIANDNGNNGSDHAVYGDARLIKADYNVDSEFNSNIQKTSYYDKILSSNSIDENITKHEDLILKRALVNRVGFQTLQRLYKDENNKAGIDYLLKNERALKYYITGGEVSINGSYADSITSFCNLYNAHGEEFEDSTDDYFNLRLAISTSLAYGRQEITRFWNTSNKEISAVKRYEAYKKLISSGVMDKAGEGDGNNKWSSAQFKALTVPMMRWVVDTRMNEDELQWLADYALTKKADGKDFLSGYTYIKYTTGYNYNKPELYDQANKQKYDDKYHFSKYYSDYGTQDVKRLWMVFEEGSVCGGLAKTYANLAEVFGRPASGVGQPGHAATITYMWNNKTNQYEWMIQNDIYGWAKSGNEYQDRMLNWGNQSWCDWQSAAYIALATDAVETPQAYTNYEKATILNLLADSYSDENKKEEAYNKALDIQKINYDSFVGLVNLYRNSKNKTDNDYFNLGKKLVDAYTYYPYALNDLTKLVREKISDKNVLAQFDLMKNSALLKAQTATSENVKQPDICKKMADSIVGSTTVNLASFSFNGDNAGKIVIDPSYNESNIMVRYSIDGGNTWIQTGDHVITLTQDQINSITAENDIKVGLVGSNDIFTIDIQKGEAPNDATLYKNDLENRLIGKTENLEYSTNEGETWNDYTADTRFPGDQVVKVRYKANGVYLQSDMGQNTFKKDTSTPERSYITIDKLKLYSFSSQQSDGKDHAAKNMIDGTENTSWHTKFNSNNDDKYYAVEFDKVRYLTSVEYKPAAVNGRLKGAEVYTSMDGNTWTKSGEAIGFANDTSMKTIDLTTPVATKYVKIVAKGTYGNYQAEYDKYFSGKMFNFFEDTIKDKSTEVETPTVEEIASTTNAAVELKAEETPKAEDSKTETNTSKEVSNYAENKNTEPSNTNSNDDKYNTSNSQLSADEMKYFESVIEKIEAADN